MGCTYMKRTREDETIDNTNINNHAKERRSKPDKKTSKKKKKKKKKSASASPSNNENVGSEESACFKGNNNNEEAIDAKNNASSTPLSSSDEAETKKKKVNLEKKRSKPMFQRHTTIENSKVARISSVSNGERGAQVVAGWPSWLASVAGEAINGWIPRKAESFEKFEKIGQGTYSSVYKARDLETNQIVALKKVRFANMDPDSVRFMAREIIVLRRLDHPNVMKLEGLITSRVSGSMYLIFEYMEHDLAGLALTSGVKFSEAQIKCYMKQMLHGLEHCHSRGILHRDIKGSNLLLDHNNNLKIGDFGLSNFYRCHQKKQQALTSRVVTLWYRPPELLLGATDYGVTVDMWSTGCVLAELFTGKPIMPGRTEVEQLHKIFKLCGSPSEDYWRKSKLPHTTIFKPQQPYKRCVAETFKSLPSSALALMEVLLAIEPDARGTTSSALQSEFFTTKPFASEPSSLPKYQPKKEIDSKVQEEEGRKKGARCKQNDSKCQGHSNVDAAGSRIEPLKSGTGQNCGDTRYGMYSVNRNGASVVMGSSRTQRSFVQRGATTQLSRFSNSVAGRDGSHFAIANPRWLEAEDSYYNSNKRQNDGDWSQRLVVKDRDFTKDKEVILGFSEKTERVQYSGPLVSSRGSLDEMLKEHERKIQLAVRRARADKKMNIDDENKQSQAFLAPHGR